MIALLSGAATTRSRLRRAWANRSEQPLEGIGSLLDIGYRLCRERPLAHAQSLALPHRLISFERQDVTLKCVHRLRPQMERGEVEDAEDDSGSSVASGGRGAAVVLADHDVLAAQAQRRRSLANAFLDARSCQLHRAGHGACSRAQLACGQDPSHGLSLHRRRGFVWPTCLFRGLLRISPRVAVLLQARSALKPLSKQHPAGRARRRTRGAWVAVYRPRCGSGPDGCRVPGF